MSNENLSASKDLKETLTMPYSGLNTVISVLKHIIPDFSSCQHEDCAGKLQSLLSLSESCYNSLLEQDKKLFFSLLPKYKLEGTAYILCDILFNDFESLANPLQKLFMRKKRSKRLYRKMQGCRQKRNEPVALYALGIRDMWNECVIN